MSELPKDEFLAETGKEIIGDPGTIGGPGAPIEPPLSDPAAEIAEAADDTPLNIDGTRFVATAMLMTYVSVLAVSAEYSGYNDILPKIPEMVATSMAHPALGYIGGGVAGLATLRRSPGVQTTAILAGATAANFLTEKAQNVMVAAPEFGDFMSRQNLPETGKDYVFALLGAGLFMLQRRRQNS